MQLENKLDSSLDVSGLGKIADSKLANKIYDDVLHRVMVQAGLAGEDVVKTARLLITAPFQLLSALEDRLEAFCKQIALRVPESRRVAAPPEIAGPALELLRFTEEDNPRATLLLNLLAKAMDSARQAEAHPAFVQIIGQLSTDESLILYHLREHEIRDLYVPTEVDESLSVASQLEHLTISFTGATMPLVGPLGVISGDNFIEQIRQSNIRHEFATLPIASRDLSNVIPISFEHMPTSFAHLDGLRLVEKEGAVDRNIVVKLSGTEEGKPVGYVFDGKMSLTVFGRSFVEACIPTGGFPQIEEFLRSRRASARPAQRAK